MAALPAVTPAPHGVSASHEDTGILDLGLQEFFCHPNSGSLSMTSTATDFVYGVISGVASDRTDAPAVLGID